MSKSLRPLKVAALVLFVILICMIMLPLLGCNVVPPTAPAPPDAVLSTATQQTGPPRFVCNNADNPPPWCDDDNWSVDSPPGQGGTPPGQETP